MEPLKLVILFLFAGLIFIILGIAYFIFWIFMLIDCINRRFDKKLKWLLIINLVPFGSIFYYFIVKKKDAKGKKETKPKEFETLAVISFIMGVVSFKIFIYFGLVLGALSIILGAMAKKRIQKNPKLDGMELAKAGIVLSIVGAALQILVIIFYISFISFILLADETFKKNNTSDFNTDFANAVQDNLYVQNTKTYTIDGIDYEVTAKNITSLDVIFEVNGMITPKLGIDEEYTLPDGAVLKVNDLEVYSNTAAVNFYLGSS